MEKPIADIRKEYTKASLLADEVAENPIEQFRKWFDEATSSDVLEPNAMNLATADGQKISSRIVLLKDIDDDGLIFYTNYESNKGKQMADNPVVALNFFWPELERQVRFEGTVEKVNEERSLAYFHSRPRSSQIGAWVSPQSQVIEARDFLEKRVESFDKKFAGKDIPKPEHWGGYKVRPNLIEFWQGRPSRLHDRLVYNLHSTNKWKIERLSP